MTSPASSLQPPASTFLLDKFRRDKSRGVNQDIDLSLRPAYRELLARLGDPHKHLPPIFHVAGTNGKGSVCAFLRAMLEAAGHRVHVYTSPHLVHFHERIRIAGELIGEDELADILETCLRLSPENGVTYFEAATAAAFYAFARHPADFTVLEVGLGGRLDATNVIDRPLASIITRLSYDHRDYLGDKLADIAREKAGIMRNTVPCFAAAQPDVEAFAALDQAAAKTGAPLLIGGRDWRIEKTADGFAYSDAAHRLDLPPPSLIGDHQYGNAGLAIAALANVTKISVEAMRQGVAATSWPARLQRLTRGVLFDRLPPGWQLWLDGGHNDSAGAALARQAEIWSGERNALPLHLIAGMLTSKHPAEFLGPLRPHIASFRSVAIADEASGFSAEEFAAKAHEAGIENPKACPSLAAALDDLAHTPASAGRILICGSLYLVGQALRANGV